MAPVPSTEDYYQVLEVGQDATSEQIRASYKRLALQLHPDKNLEYNTTAAFQRLARAHETLGDIHKRYLYDHYVYPFITRECSSGPWPQELSEAAQIDALNKAKKERAAQWRSKQSIFDSAVFELRRIMRRLEQEIKNLQSIRAAEVAAEAQKNSWATWLLSPIYKTAEDSEEVKARKDIERQERRLEEDMKERRMEKYQSDLEKKEKDLQKTKDLFDAADRCDDIKIRKLEARIHAREYRAYQERLAKLQKEQQERDRIERERLAKLQEEERERREEQAREAAAARQKRAAEQRTFEELQQLLGEQRRRRDSHSSPYGGDTAHCRHDGWWPKVLGRANCPVCGDSWTYLLQCPLCTTRACPKCQCAMRPRVQRHRPGVRPGVGRMEQQRPRTPSPDRFRYIYGFDWD